MRSLSFGLAAAALAALVATASNAQDTRGVQPPKAKAAEQQTGDAEKDKAKGMAEAPAVLQQAGVACTVSDALWKGTAKTDVAGKKVNTKFYEVACSDAPGYVLMAPDGVPPKAYDCLAMNQAAASGQSGVSCTLAANAEPYKGLQPVVTKAGVRCTVTSGRWSGANVEKKYDQYEVGCSEGIAYIIQIPQGGSAHKLTALDCIKASAQNVTCQLMPKDQVIAAVMRMAAPANKPACQATDVRYMGETASKNVFYEVGCADGKSGFVFQTDAAGKFVNAIECARASTISGGCTFTTAVVTPGEETGLYTKLVSGIGYQCTVQNYRPLGLEPNTGREIVEVACNGKSAPAVAFLPAGTPGQKGEVWDCARAEARGLKCGLVQAPASYALINEKITAAGKECRVTKTRYVGTTAEGGDYVEVGCDGGGALMVEYGPGLQVVKAVLNCGEAKKVGGGCKFITIG